jgi:hypothetical protein
MYRADTSNSMTAVHANKLDAIQEMIAEEIARRTQSIDSENLVVRKKLLTALARTVSSRDPVYWVPPLIVG